MRRSREVFKDTLRLSEHNKLISAGMAQLVEQRIRNAQVIGSSPITSSKIRKQIILFPYFFIL